MNPCLASHRISARQPPAFKNSATVIPGLYSSNLLPAAVVGRLGFFATQTRITSPSANLDGRPLATWPFFAGAFFELAFLASAFLAFGDRYFKTP